VGRFIRAVGLAVGVALAASSTQAAERTSFRALIGQGFEIKVVTLVPLESASRVDQAVNYDTTFVTLQKGHSVAVCYFSLANWIALNEDSLANTSLCDVR